MPAFTGWGYSKDLPKFAGKTFRERFASKQESAYKGKQLVEKTPHIEAETLRSAQSDINRVEQFIESLTKVNGNIVRTKKSDVTDKIIEFLKSRNIDSIHLEPNVMDEDALQKAGITINHERDANIRVGVTKSICGLADTGSVLETDGEGDKLFASLLPEIHLAILHESDIYPSLENAIYLTRQTNSAAFITGPSRTGDIEMSHTIGVHGPGEIVVFLLS